MRRAKLFFSYIAVLVISGAGIFWAQDFMAQSDRQERSLYYISPNIKYFSFGYNESMADSLWLRVLQDFDMCEQGKLGKNESRMGAHRKFNCTNGWVYRMLDATTELAPKFRLVYLVGGTSLSVLVDDIEGAGKIFDKGTKAFPTDWEIHYRAGYHYLMDREDSVQAARHLRLAAENGAPGWVMGLSARLYSKQGRLEYAERMLVDFIPQVKDPRFRERLEMRLAEIQKQIKDSQKAK